MHVVLLFLSGSCGAFLHHRLERVRYARLFFWQTLLTPTHLKYSTELSLSISAWLLMCVGNFSKEVAEEHAVGSQAFFFWSAKIFQPQSTVSFRVMLVAVSGVW